MSMESKVAEYNKAATRLNAVNAKANSLIGLFQSEATLGNHERMAAIRTEIHDTVDMQLDCVMRLAELQKQF